MRIYEILAIAGLLGAAGIASAQVGEAWPAKVEIGALKAGSAATATVRSVRVQAATSADGKVRGTVLCLPPGGSKPVKCAAAVRAEVPLRIVAEPAAGAAFSRWSGACADAREGRCTVQPRDGMVVEAWFVPAARAN